MSEHAPEGGVYLQNPPGFTIAPELLLQFERGLDPSHPEQSRVPAHVLGYGEISTVFAIDVEGVRGLAFKRLPIFHTQAELTAFLYHPARGAVGVRRPPGRPSAPARGGFDDVPLPPARAAQGVGV